MVLYFLKFDLIYLSAPGYDCDVFSGDHHLGFGKGDLVVTHGDLVDGGAVEDFGLEKHAGVGVSDAGEQEALGLSCPAGYHNLKETPKWLLFAHNNDQMRKGLEQAFCC